MIDPKNTPIKYDIIGVGYNTTRRADPYLFSRLFALLSPAPDGQYIDIGCGTGNYTIEFSKKGIQFTGVDPSHEMLHIANSKSKNVQWLYGVVENIPASDGSFDGATATLTLHHWKDLSQGILEVWRVLKPGSRFVIFTSSPEQMNSYWLNHYFPSLIERSAQQMPSIGVVLSALEDAGFTNIELEKYFVRDDLQDLFLQSGKNRPEMYFDEKIRKGISTFSSLSNKAEVDAGLKMLKDDLENGNFQSVKEQYECDTGDYMFVVAEKLTSLKSNS